MSIRGRLSPFASLVTVVLALTFVAGSPGPANAGATPTTLRYTTVEDSPDIGCREMDVLHLEGDVLLHQVIVHGGLQTNVLTTGTVTFEEAGQSFAGTFSRTFAGLFPADGSVVFTQQFTSTARGDLGDAAVLHVTAHVTYLASSGTLTAAFSILHQSCT